MKKSSALNILAVLFSLALLGACNSSMPETIEPAFESRKIAEDYENLWANCPADITGDGISDLVLITNNAYGGSLGYLEGKLETGLWELVIVADTAPGGGLFAQGDMECADMDGDGDIDIVAGEHPGEWKNSSAPTMLYWFENPGWEVHPIGEAADFVKDISLVHLNGDKRCDLAVMTYDSNTLRIFVQEDADSWTLVQNLEGFDNLHEGMDAGDLDGDGFADIFANGHIFYNPAGDLSLPWKHENMDAKWNSQSGDWSRNGSKTRVFDVDGDGMAEVFISHSERSGFPMSMYKREASGSWKERVLVDSIPACHTMQVSDFNLDGKMDVLTGVNSGRASGLGYTSFPVYLLLDCDDPAGPDKLVLDSSGIYNGQIGDFDGDGDTDIFRLRQHGDSEIHLMINQIK